METLVIGRLGKTFGIKGFFKVMSFSGEYGHFYDLGEVTLKNGPQQVRLEIESVKPMGTGVIIKFQDINSPEAGQKYVNWEIWVPRDQACPLKEGEYYQSELCQCRLFYGNSVIGQVVSVVESGAAELLEIALETKGTRFVPFSHQFIGQVNLKEKRIELLHDWILE